MKIRLLMILCLVGSGFAKKPPDVDCVVIGLKYVKCLWNTSDVNYTFYSRFHHQSFRECDTYILKNGLNVGCKQPEDDIMNKRFNTYYTKFQQEDQNPTEHHLKNRVKLDPPSNLTVQFRSDSSLCFEWRLIYKSCVESEVRCRLNNDNWQVSMVGPGLQEYCFNLPSNSSRYELQVRNRVSNNCGPSKEWSEWSDPVIWGAHNKTDLTGLLYSVNVWTVVMYFVGGATLLLLIVLLLHHERIRIILIPVVPKPSLVTQDFKEWLDSPKGLKDVFKPSYTERTCSVREYCPVPPSDSESSDSSIVSVSTDQTVCYNPVPNPDLNHPGPSSSSTEFVPPEEQHISV
ncbi:hypothetical protein NQD34_010180 [Periophthalmus magnuspinnatus]|nr:hypothetical protein NQD34_010180 [Periophthalmus magnuspinnatus]